MNKSVIIGLTLYAFTSSAHAQQLVHTPVNPAFGGSSFNYSYLQGTADAQNIFKRKQNTKTATSTTQQFVQMLQTRLYSALAQRVSDALLGENCTSSCSGEITLGDQTVSYSNDGSSITLQITNSAGQVTTITVPSLSASAD
jgi:curli production assembly/transport component CsgF